jgi:hypothetical protein
MIMKKRFMLVLVTLMLALGAQAQFEQGTWYFNVSSTGFELSHSDATKTRLALSANVGNFIADNIALIVGTNADFYSGLSEFGVGTQARYYFPTCGVYGGLGVQYAYTKIGDYDKSLMFLTPEVGYTFFLNRYLTIEPAVFYRMNFSDFEHYSKVGLRIGFGFYF